MTTTFSPTDAELWHAAEMGDASTLCCPSVQKPWAQCRNAHGESLVHVLVENGHTEALRQLLSVKGQRLDEVLNHASHGLRTPLMMAIEKDNEEALGLLLHHGADITMESTPALRTVQSQRGTLLAWAVKQRKTVALQRLLDEGLFPNQVFVNDHGEQRGSVLCLAIDSNNTKGFECLLSAGADVNQASWRGCTPLFRAALKDDPYWVERLLDNGANVRCCNKDGVTSLHMAMKSSNDILKVVERMLVLGAAPDAITKNGESLSDWLPSDHPTGEKLRTVVQEFRIKKERVVLQGEANRANPMMCNPAVLRL